MIKLDENIISISDTKFIDFLEKMRSGKLSFQEHKVILKTLLDKIILGDKRNWYGAVTDNIPKPRVGDLIILRMRGDNGVDKVDLVIGFDDNSNLVDAKPRFNGTYCQRYTHNGKRCFSFAFPSIDLDLRISNPNELEDTALIEKYSFDWLNKLYLKGYGAKAKALEEELD